MRILLINPPAVEVYGPYKPAARVVAQPQMPHGLCYIGAALEQRGHQISIIDCDVDELGISQVVDKAGQLCPDLVGVTATTPLYHNAGRILSLVKERHKGVITVLGGYHLTALPMEAMAHCPVDYGVYGEGEETIVELVEALEQGTGVGEVRGVLYRQDGEVVMNLPRPLISDLDEIPFPARHLLRCQRYLWSVPGKGWQPVTAIVTQRGCPYQCVFCGVRTMFPRVRYRRVEHIVDEIEYIVTGLGTDHIQFQDDTLTLKTEKVVGMCEEIKRRKLRFTWEGYTRTDRITKDLLKTMKEVGLVRISFGVESGNQRILDAIKKGTTLEQYRQAYEWCDELGLETRCSVMLGHPFETRETVKQTVAFLCSLKVYQAYINIAMPYPGSTLLEMARAGYGGLRLLTEDWGEYRRYGNAVMEVNDLTREDLIWLQKWAYLKFYLRPRIIKYNLKRAGLQAAFINVMAFVASLFKPFNLGGRAAHHGWNLG